MRNEKIITLKTNGMEFSYGLYNTYSGEHRLLFLEKPWKVMFNSNGVYNFTKQLNSPERELLVIKLNNGREVQKAALRFDSLLWLLARIRNEKAMDCFRELLDLYKNGVFDEENFCNDDIAETDDGFPEDPQFPRARTREDEDPFA